MIIGLSFVEDALYVFQDNAILVYDENAVVDFDGNANIGIVKRIESNPISIDESYVKVQNVHLTYSCPEQLKALVVVDNQSCEIKLPAGTGVHVEKKLPRSAKKNGLYLGFILTVVADTITLNDFTMFIRGAIRKALNRG